MKNAPKLAAGLRRRHPLLACGPHSAPNSRNMRVPCWLATTGVVSLLLLLLWQSRSNSLPARPNARFGFVHVPKAAGLAITRIVLGPTCSDVAVEKRAHTQLESDVLAAGLRPLIVLRPPLQRLRSAFDFWQHGSSELSGLQATSPQSKMLLLHQRRIPWELFLDGLLNESSPHRSSVHVMTTAGQALSGWAWGVHFAPLHHFVDREDARAIFVCYSRELMASRLSCMAEELQMRCNFSSVAEVNPTLKGTGPPAREAGRERPVPPVPPQLRRLLRARLAADEAIYARHCSQCTRFTKCCHSVGRTGDRRPSRVRELAAGMVGGVAARGVRQLQEDDRVRGRRVELGERPVVCRAGSSCRVVKVGRSILGSQVDLST